MKRKNLKTVMFLAAVMFICVGIKCPVFAAREEIPHCFATKGEFQYGGPYKSAYGKEITPSKSQIAEMDSCKEVISFETVEYKHSGENHLYLAYDDGDFRVYVLAKDNSLIVRTPDNKYYDPENIRSAGSWDLYNPHFQSGDYDGDGEQELLCRRVMVHGAGYIGFNSEAIYILDKDSRSKWHFYYLDYDEYIENLYYGLDAYRDGDDFVLEYGGSKVGVTWDENISDTISGNAVDHYEMCCDSAIGFYVYGDEIYIESPILILEFSSPEEYHHGGSYGSVFAKILYDGNGNFRLSGKRVGSYEGLDGGSDLEKLKKDKIADFLTFPQIDFPVLLAYDESKYEDDGSGIGEIEGYVIKDNKCVLLGKIKAVDKSVGIRCDVDGLIIGDGHSFTKYVPDDRSLCWKTETINDKGVYIDENGEQKAFPGEYEKYEKRVSNMSVLGVY